MLNKLFQQKLDARKLTLKNKKRLVILLAKRLHKYLIPFKSLKVPLKLSLSRPLVVKRVKQQVQSSKRSTLILQCNVQKQ